MELRFRNFDSATREQKTTISFTMETCDDEMPDISYIETDTDDAQANIENRERLTAFNRGDWHMIGIRAKAEIIVPIGQQSFCHYTLTSAGCWGIESDSGDAFFAEIFKEEKAELIKAMKAIGAAASELS